MAKGVFVGLSTIDLIYAVDSFPAPNGKAVARSQELVVGGPATNAAITFSHLGNSAVLTTAIGRSKLASIIKDELACYSIEIIDLAPDYDGVPAISSVSVDPEGRRSVVSVNASMLTGSSLSLDTTAHSSARILLVDGHSMSACQAWAHAAHSAGIPVVFDGGSWKSGTDQLLKSVDIAICSADFLLPGCTGEGEVVRYLQACGVRQIAITRGAEPIRFASSFSAGTILVPRVDVVDTTGAGDIFHGAFCHHFISGSDFVESLHKAAVIATRSCRYPGTRRWMQAE
jgi:sugar/nucleoside kinase (ribokinase family)